MTMLANRLDVDEILVEETQTQVNLRALPNPWLRNEVGRRNLVAFSRATGALLPDPDGLVQWIEVCPTSVSDRSVVALVDDLKERLDLPLRTVLRSAGIKPRTFYTWTSDSTIEPRVASAGRLWDFAAAVEDLEGNVPDLKVWFADESRRSLLERGAFEELIALAIRSRYPMDQKLAELIYTADDSIEVEWLDALPTPNAEASRRATRVL